MELWCCQTGAIERSPSRHATMLYHRIVQRKGTVHMSRSSVGQHPWLLAHSRSLAGPLGGRPLLPPREICPSRPIVPRTDLERTTHRIGITMPATFTASDWLRRAAEIWTEAGAADNLHTKSLKIMLAEGCERITHTLRRK